ncbi:hypothetical protein COLO4_16557 [Corchorus olitorius]|uniref:Uncharacterized protein n=1 Tax=Corchorus olitorius TaxID=93759 RepID=A0A1R3JGQ2_9ROSI|nr:hypothetical protein COLO4_16557 [Corchorus olitorius]
MAAAAVPAELRKPKTADHGKLSSQPQKWTTMLPNKRA